MFITGMNNSIFVKKNHYSKPKKVINNYQLEEYSAESVKNGKIKPAIFNIEIDKNWPKDIRLQGVGHIIYM